MPLLSWYPLYPYLFFFNDTTPTEIYTRSLHDALPIYDLTELEPRDVKDIKDRIESKVEEIKKDLQDIIDIRSEEHTSELQSRLHLVCRLLLDKKKQNHSSE
mgnify:CR=1 FL=1